MHVRTLLCSALSWIALAGCEVEEFFFTYHNIAPGEGCAVTAEGNLYLPRGTLDVFAGRGYELFPLLVNNLPARKRASDLSDQTEPNLLQLRRYEVNVRPPSGFTFSDSLTHSTYDTSGALLPGDRRASHVSVLSDALATELRDQNLVDDQKVEFLVEVTAIAEDGLGQEISTEPFIYPIDVCLGCLVVDLGFCSSTSTDAAGRFGNTCGLPQDERVGCCRTSDMGRICLARPEGSS